MKIPLLFLASVLFMNAPLVQPIRAAEPLADANAAMRSLLNSKAAKMDAEFLDGITNKAQFEAARGRMRKEYLDMLGLDPLPPKTPLQAHVTGIIERPEGFRVEKVHFQSKPGLYVTGNIYVPSKLKPGEQLPAVLYVCGHSGRGRDGNKTAFQHHGMWFATHGYVCLIIDTLQLGEIAAIHHGTYRYNRWWWQARGYTPAGVECWNGIRALDYLRNRPEVDPDRLAVTGISGGGAATFWIAAADERVKVAVPVSGMADLQEYVGEKIVNGHCDCMFMINTFQWPWTHIAALIAPRPMLFENSGHDTIFPMNANDRIRSRLEKLYSFYTNRTDRLFDIGVEPGGHDDKPELRLMAYRWINRHLKKEEGPVTEPDLPKIEGKDLRAFPNELPADELNSKIDESFVAQGRAPLPVDARSFEEWRAARKQYLDSHVFRGMHANSATLSPVLQDGKSGVLRTSHGLPVAWRYFGGGGTNRTLVVLNEDESLETKPIWATNGNSVLVIGPIGHKTVPLDDPPPFTIKRSLALLGLTVDGLRFESVLEAARAAVQSGGWWTIGGQGQAGVLGAYAAIYEPGLKEILAIAPPASHVEGPIFLNVLRNFDIPEALGMLAPRSLTVRTDSQAFERTAAIYRALGASINIQKP